MPERRWSIPRVAYLSDQPVQRASVLATIAATMPGVAAVAATEADEGDQGAASGADALVVDGGEHGEHGLSLLRRAREHGFDGGAVVLVDDDASALEGRSGLGEVRLVPRAQMARELPRALLELLRRFGTPAPGESSDDESNMASLAQELRRVQRLLVAGEAALRLPHALNNPLGALLAEAQLLQLEELSADQREAVERMITLCRRMTSIVRGFEEVTRA